MYGLLSNKPCAKTLICRISSEKRKRTLPSIYQHLKLFLFIPRTKAVLLNFLSPRSTIPFQTCSHCLRFLSHCSKKEREGKKRPERFLEQEKCGGRETGAARRGCRPHGSHCEPWWGCSSPASMWGRSTPDGILGGRSWAAAAEPPPDAGCCWGQRRGRTRTLASLPQRVPVGPLQEPEPHR